MKELLKAIANAKKDIGKISKDSENPFFKSKYFDINKLIDSIEDILTKHGLLLLQPIIDNKVTSEIYHVESGDRITSSIPLPVISDPQKLGSAITYYRRYTLQSLLSLQAEDDDANQATKAVKTKPELTPDHPQWKKAKSAIEMGTITQQEALNKLKAAFSLSMENETKFLK